jgi:FkbM family methyltransferase
LIEGVTVGHWRVGRLPAYDSLEYHLRSVILRLGVTEVIDVGAHHGEYGDMLRHWVRFRGPIHSFEPATAAFGHLSKRAARDTGWHTWPLALAAECGRRPLNKFDATVLNSLASPSNYAIEKHPGMRAAGTEYVDTRRLDQLSNLGIRDQSRLLLKVDTQGTDLEVLRGAQGVLSQVVAIQIEAATRPLYNGMPSVTDTIEHLTGAGFTLSGLFPVGRAADLGLVDVDVVAVRMFE